MWNGPFGTTLPPMRALLRTNALAAAILVVVVAVLVWSLLAVPWFRSPEGPDYLIRLELLARELVAQGRMPRWIPELAGEHGYPLFTYYAPGSLLLALPLRLAGLEPSSSLMALVVLAALGGGWALIAAVRSLHGGLGAGLVAAALYLASPFWVRSLYADGNLSQVTAHALAPVVLLAAVRAATLRRLGDHLALAAAIGVFTTLHTVSTLTYGVMLGLLGALVLVERRAPVRTWAAFGGAALAGLAASAWFWLPAIAEKPLVHSEVLLTGFFDFRRAFVAPGVPGAVLAGAGWFLVAFAALGAAGALLARSGRALTIGAVLAALGALSLGAAASLPLWEHLPLLQYAQPNRLAGPATLALVVAAGAIGRLAIPSRVAMAAAAMLPLAIALSGAPDSRMVQAMPPEERQADPFETCGFGEYLPVTVTERPAPGGPPALFQGDGVVVEARHDGTHIEARVRADASGWIVLRAFDFPGWTVTLDGAPAQHWHDEQGRIGLPVPEPGVYAVEATLTATPLERAAETTSSVAWAALAGLAVWRSLRRRAEGGTVAV